ncbi:hypothetical protein ACHAW6_010109 [Cyclotella cf. meneghiniana]
MKTSETGKNPDCEGSSSDGRGTNGNEDEPSFHPVDIPLSTEVTNNQSLPPVKSSFDNVSTQVTSVDMDETTPILEPTPNDCLVGRGGGTNHHMGNKKYRALVNRYKPEYHAANRSVKPMIAMRIVREWREQDPPGRFLKQDEDTKLWYEVGDEKARGKTSQSLREKDVKGRLSDLSAVSVVRAESFSSTRSEVAREVESAVISVGVPCDEMDRTLAEVGIDRPAISKLLNTIRSRLDVELTSSIANDTINQLTERVLVALSEMSGAMTPLPTGDTKLAALAAAAEAVKSPPKENGMPNRSSDDDAEVEVRKSARKAENIEVPIVAKEGAPNKWQPEEDERLRELVKNAESYSRGLRWTDIADGMNGRSPKQCRERWVHHLRPGLKKGNWTLEEDELIKSLHSKYGNSWNKIAGQMQGRSENALKNRWNSWKRAQKVQDDPELENSFSSDSLSSEEEMASLSLLQLRESPLTLPESVVTVPANVTQNKKRKGSTDTKGSLKENIQPQLKKLKSKSSTPVKDSIVLETNRNPKVLWNKHDDELLKQLVARKSHTDECSTWNAIAKEIKNRTGKQCRERWVNQLSMPERKKGNWTKAEDRIISARQAEWGNTWSAISDLLPGRTDNDVKNRWYSTQRTKKRHKERPSPQSDN